MKNFKFIFTALLGLSSFNLVFAYAPTNFYTPYNINWRLPDCEPKKFLFGANIEHGSTKDSWNLWENKSGLLRLYNATESSLAMLLGADPGSAIYEKATLFLPAYSPATDDGVRGHFELDGEFEMTNLNLLAKYKLPIKTIPGNFDLYVHVPFSQMEIKNVVWRDLTKSVLVADLDVHQNLTDSFFNNIYTLGDGLSLDGFERFGISDIVTQIWWYNDYKQIKDHLKNVRLNFRLGLSAPTGHRINSDKILDLPMGNNGAWGVPVGAAIDLHFIREFKAGLEFDLLFVFDTSDTYRLKTDINQTDFLLLHKGKATLSQGISWKFNLFMQKKFGKFVTAKIAYQYLKHDSDKFTAESNKFDYSIINSAERLQEWNTQDFIFQLNFDFFKEKSNYAMMPQISLFTKLPVSGKRVIKTYTVGGQLAFNF